jgi:hypothetical protein
MEKLQNIHLDEVRNIYVSPKVDFNAENGVCEISGESFLEETSKFYSPLVEWIQQYMKTGRPITFNIKLSYFNTSTSKWLLRILYLLSEYQNKAPVSINWYIYKEDIDLVEDIEDFMEDVGIKINIVLYENEENSDNPTDTDN